MESDFAGINCFAFAYLITSFLLQYDRHHEKIGIKGIPGRHLEPSRHTYPTLVIPGIRSIHHTKNEHYRLTKPG